MAFEEGGEAGPEAQYPSPARAWTVAGLLTAAYFLSFVDRSIIFLLVEPIKADIGATDFQMGLLAGLAFSLFYCIAALPLGRLADRTNRVVLVSSGIALWSAMTIACGLSRNYAQLFLSRMGVGIGEASIGPSAVSLIGDYFPPEKSARPTAMLSAGSVIGGACAFFIGGLVLGWATENGVPPLPLIGDVEPWQFTFIVCGLPGLILAPIILYFVKEPIRRNVLKGENKSLFIPFLKRRWKTYLGFFVGFGLLLSIGYAFSAWFPTMLQRIYGWPPAQIGTAIGVVSLVFGLLGPILATTVVDGLTKRGRDDALLLASIFFAACCSGSVIVGLLIPEPWPSFLISSLAIVFMAAMAAIAYMAIQVLAPNQFRAQLTAVSILASSIFGSTIGPALTGMFTDFVFRDEMMIKWSLIATTVVMTPIILGLFLWCRSSFIASIHDSRAWRSTSEASKADSIQPDGYGSSAVQMKTTARIKEKGDA